MSRLFGLQNRRSADSIWNWNLEIYKSSAFEFFPPFYKANFFSRFVVPEMIYKFPSGKVPIFLRIKGPNFSPSSLTVGSFFMWKCWLVVYVQCVQYMASSLHHSLWLIAINMGAEVWQLFCHRLCHLPHSHTLYYCTSQSLCAKWQNKLLSASVIKRDLLFPTEENGKQQPPLRLLEAARY